MRDAHVWGKYNATNDENISPMEVKDLWIFFIVSLD